MSIFTRGAYAINFANASYIDAIAKYNQKSYINKITDSAGKAIALPEERKSLSNLKLIIQELSASSPAIDEINVEYLTGNSSSMFGVFPMVAPQHIAGSAETLSSSYLDGVVFNATDSREMYMVLPEPPATLTREEAMSLVQKYDCSGAIELQELNTVVFEYKNACFYLSYGTPCEIGHMNNIVLDLDDGFLFKYPEDSSPRVNSIASTLQTHFLTWKGNNYEGPLFTQSMGLNFEPVVHAAAAVTRPSQGGMFAQTASAYITVGIDAADYVDFKAVDSRIEHRGGWMERYSMGTSIAFPTQYAEEILNKLKQHRDITSVGSELTARGTQVQDEMRAFFGSFK